MARCRSVARPERKQLPVGTGKMSRKSAQHSDQAIEVGAYFYLAIPLRKARDGAESAPPQVSDRHMVLQLVSVTEHPWKTTMELMFKIVFTDSGGDPQQYAETGELLTAYRAATATARVRILEHAGNINGRTSIRIIPRLADGTYAAVHQASTADMTLKAIDASAGFAPGMLAEAPPGQQVPIVMVEPQSLEKARRETTEFWQHPADNVLLKTCCVPPSNHMLAGYAPTKYKLPLPEGTAFDGTARVVFGKQTSVGVNTFRADLVSAMKKFERGFVIGPNRIVWVPTGGNVVVMSPHADELVSHDTASANIAEVNRELGDYDSEGSDPDF